MAEKKKSTKKEGPKKKPAMKEENAKRPAEKISHKAGEGKPAEKASRKAEKPAGKEEKKAAVKEEKGKEEEKGKGKEKKKREEKKKPKRKFKKPEKPVIKKSVEVKRLSRLVRAKKRRMFRGRFGKRGSVRKISDRKWQKWRRPRGIDIYFKKEDGLVPGSGYGTANKIRFVHPSGYREVLVRNMQELVSLEKEKEKVAARVSGKLGLKKKIEMLKKADELKIVVLNR